MVTTIGTHRRTDFLTRRSGTKSFYDTSPACVRHISQQELWKVSRMTHHCQKRHSSNSSPFEGSTLTAKKLSTLFPRSDSSTQRYQIWSRDRTRQGNEFYGWRKLYLLVELLGNFFFKQILLKRFISSYLIEPCKVCILPLICWIVVRIKFFTTRSRLTQLSIKF